MNLILTPLLLLAQFLSLGGNGQPAYSAAPTWTLVNSTIVPYSFDGVDTNSLTIPSTGSGHALIVLFKGYNSTQITISSVSGAGTWNLCPASACASFVSYSGQGLMADMAYNLSSTSGITSVTVNLSGAPADGAAAVFEYSKSSGTISYDTAGTATSSVGCTACVGAALTLSGSDDVVAIMGTAENDLTAVTGSFTSPGIVASQSDQYVGALNQSVVTAPTWTQASLGAFATSEIALK